jgi:myo-inositol catabolism protein IolH
MDIGQGEVDRDVFFSSLAAVGFGGIMTACVFAREERADQSGCFMREEMQKYVEKYWSKPKGKCKV